MIVVTGSTGHLGNVLVRQLLEAGEQAKALTCPQDDCPSLADLQVEPLEVDLLDASALEKAFAGAHTVYHLAAYISILPGEEDKLYAINVRGTENVIQACFHQGVRRMVYVSSSHVLGLSSDGSPINEAFPIRPHRLMEGYVRSKALATLKVMEAVQKGLDAVIAIPSGILGPQDFGPSHMGRMCLEAATVGRTFYVDGGYDFVDVRDVAEALQAMAKKTVAGERFLLTGAFLSDRRALEILREEFGITGPLIKIPSCLASPLAHFNVWWQNLVGQADTLFTPQAVEDVFSGAQFCSDKARRELDFRPRSPEKSLRDTLRWFRRASML